MASRDAARPNVVFVVADDLGSWALGAYGNEAALTPTLDGLSAGGVRLDRFFCTSPVCSPARASMLTGQIPSQHGVHDWIAAGHGGPAGVDYLAGRTTLDALAAAAGYRVGLSGKWHLGASDQPREGFVHWFAHESGGGPYFGAPMFRGRERLSVEGYLTDALADDAIAFVESEAERGAAEPFLLHLHFTAPHSPWVDSHPQELVALFEDRELRSWPEEPPHPWLLLHNKEVAAAVVEPERSLQGYFAAVAGLDRALGRVLGSVESLGLTESTLVVFVSDNGFNCGQHGIWGKGNGTFPQNMFDTSVLVPGIFSQPGRIPPGSSSALLSGYDVLPSLVEYLGLDWEVPLSLPGRSFAPLLGGSGGRDAGGGHVVVFDEYGPVRMLRTAEWKYVERRAGPDELYDLATDPHETCNLAGMALHAEREACLREELRRWFARYVDPANDGFALPVNGLGQVHPSTPGHPAGFVPFPED